MLLYILLWWWMGCTSLIISVHMNGETVNLREIIPLLYMGLLDGPFIALKLSYGNDDE